MAWLLNAKVFICFSLAQTGWAQAAIKLMIAAQSGVARAALQIVRTVRPVDRVVVPAAIEVIAVALSIDGILVVV